MSVVDFESKKLITVITLANGGVPVKLRGTSDVYQTVSDAVSIVSQENSGQAVGNPTIEWIPVVGMAKAYSAKAYRPFVDNSGMVLLLLLALLSLLLLDML